MTNQDDRKLPDPFEVMQRAYSVWPQIGDAARENLQTFWKNQDKMLDSMHEFSRGWFERRHEATKTALDAANCMCGAQNPIDAVQHCQTWMTGAAERVAADATAWQKHLMNTVELLAAPLSQEMQGRIAEVTPFASARSGQAKDAAA